MKPGYFHDGANQQPGDTKTWLQFTSGASGAVPASLTLSNGVASVVRDNTGLYTVTLSDVWAVNLGGHSVNILPTGGAYDATKAMAGVVFAVNLSAKTFKFATYRTDTGAATDPASGDIVTVILRTGFIPFGMEA